MTKLLLKNKQKVTFKEMLYHDKYVDFFTKEDIEFAKDFELSLKPWNHKVFVKE